MKPAVSSKKKALLPAILVGGFALYWYFVPFIWFGVFMGLISGAIVYYLLRARRMERLRRIYFFGLFVVVFTSLILVINSMGLDTFLGWSEIHEKEYYLPGQTVGALSYPCTREVPQLLLGRATFLVGTGMWQTVFPSNITEFMVLMVPFFLTGIVFGRGFCGWICPFGGLTEAFVTGRKQRWRLDFLKRFKVDKTGLRREGLKEWVKDSKYGILLAIILLSIAFAFPLVCIFCPVLWLESLIIFSVILTVLFVFAIVLPFMSKRRWWCLICPMGAVFALLNKISFFRVRMDKNKCIKCNDCAQECRMYAMTPKAIENLKSPNEDCIRCGRCIEACPEEAMDMYWLGTSRKARPWFISLAIVAALAWYAWFMVFLVDLLQ
jgi:polyferredoxin